MNKVSAAVLAVLSGLAVSHAAVGQEAEKAKPDATPELDTIVVSGTRLKADGFEAPTPVTITTAESLQLSSPANVVNGLQELPQFLGSQSFSAGGKSGIGEGRGQFLNLRNFGAGRTLVLLDGIRMPPTTYDGRVNSEIIPQMLLQRVDVVTSGASAAYGSDAVAGAVNYVLDHDFTGLKLDMSTGISKYGDSFNYRVGIAGGMAIGERGHLLASVERFQTDGIQLRDRRQGDIAYIAAGKNIGGGPPGTRGNPFVIYENATWNTLSPGGHIASGPLAGTYFNRAGQFRTYNFGTPTGSGATSIGGDGAALQPEQNVTEDADTTQGLVRFSYDLTDHLKAHVMGIYSQADASIIGGFNYFDFGHAVYSGNPYLPAAIQAQMTAQNIPSFLLQKYVTDSPLSPATDETRHYTVMAGLEGDFSVLDRDVSWNLTYTRGDTRQTAQEINTPELRKFHAAVDAVRDPATGNIVCRVTLTNPGLYPGCVPFNILGELAASQAAIDYIHDTSVYETDTTLDQLSASLQGDVFSLPAGPVSVAIGAEARWQDLTLTSNSDPSVVRPATGLRSLTQAQPRFWFSNRPSAKASLRVQEYFGEVNIPVVKDLPLLRRVDLNGAARRTDYSTSGVVTTWKWGGTWRPIDDVLLRVTRSRDIRAPSLFDLSSTGAAGRSTLDDPQTRVGAVVITAGGGNPNLLPETADSLSFGVVYTPSFAPRLSLAVDVFDLELEGAITTLSPQNVVNQCFFSGIVDPICAQVVRPISPTDTSPQNFPTLVRSGPTNSSLIQTRGADIEAAFVADLAGGSLTTRLLVSHISEYKTKASPFLPTVEQGGTNLVPDLKATLQMRYTRGPFALFLQERMIGKITLGQQPNAIWDEPPVPAMFYTDVTASYTFDSGGHDMDFFVGAKNLFNKQPPIVPGTAAPRYNFPTLGFYDVLGTMISAGVRAKF